LPTDLSAEGEGLPLESTEALLSDTAAQLDLEGSTSALDDPSLMVSDGAAQAELNRLQGAQQTNASTAAVKGQARDSDAEILPLMASQQPVSQPDSADDVLQMIRQPPDMRVAYRTTQSSADVNSEGNDLIDDPLVLMNPSSRSESAPELAGMMSDAEVLAQQNQQQLEKRLQAEQQALTAMQRRLDSAASLDLSADTDGSSELASLTAAAMVNQGQHDALQDVQQNAQQYTQKRAPQLTPLAAAIRDDGTPRATAPTAELSANVSSDKSASLAESDAMSGMQMNEPTVDTTDALTAAQAQQQASQPVTDSTALTAAQLAAERAAMRANQKPGIESSATNQPVNVAGASSVMSDSAEFVPVTAGSADLRGGRPEGLSLEAQRLDNLAVNADNLAPSTAQTSTTTSSQSSAGTPLSAMAVAAAPLAATDTEAGIYDQADAQIDDVQELSLQRQLRERLDFGQDRREWAPALGSRLVTMIADDVQQARIHLDPPELGSLEIRLEVRQDQATVQVNAQHAQVKDVLDASAQRLRDALNAEGIELADFSVSTQSGQSQQEQNESGQGSGSRDGDGEGVIADGDTSEATPVVSSHNGVLDTFA
ncbi:MAG: flagellar hook-length control protein FliK, partial [Pseudomonadota bacterium]|nr:flagellar hook-length control protein FliK [Pseudomonadota bacterium]